MAKCPNLFLLVVICCSISDKYKSPPTWGKFILHPILLNFHLKLGIKIKLTSVLLKTFSKHLSKNSCEFQIKNVPLLSKQIIRKMEITYNINDMGGYLKPILLKS